MSGLKVPDAPTLRRAESQQAVEPGPMSSDTTDGRDFVPRTLRVFTFVSVVGALLIAGTGRYELILPFAVGATLGMVLLAGFELVVRKAFTADIVLAQKDVPLPKAEGSDDATGETRPKKFGGKAAILWFALIKYPAVALLIWWITRHWSEPQILTFVGGFILLQLIIGARGLGMFLFPRTKRK
ncbi:MAG: hypothetical protein H7145_08415 [Akkermansiaceae bacterium]|nr:hypothetical protein [Armatimonadota bacterium]